MEKIDLVQMMRGGFFDSGAKAVFYCEILDLSSTCVTVRYRTSTLEEGVVRQKDFRVVLNAKVRQIDGMYYEIPDSATIESIEEIPLTPFAKQGQLFKDLRLLIEERVQLHQQITNAENLVVIPERQKKKRAR